MSTLDEKLEQHRETSGAAQRTFRSLESVRGFRLEAPRARGATPQRRVVSIEPMDERSFWQHDGHGKWDAAGAMYTKMEE